MSDVSFFDFDNIKSANGGKDPFADEVKKYKTDERFYVLPKDDKGNGSALICFLPDSQKSLIQKMYKINASFYGMGKKRFVSEWSPSTIGLPDPFQEKWQDLWNAGEKDEARKYGRTIRFLTNIKVIKDPLKPENNGKIFLYEIGQKLCDKLKQALEPSEQDIALGATRKEVFNPLRGVYFKLVSRMGSNNIINYDSSEFFVDPANPVYKSAEEAVKDIKENTYLLSEFLKPESFLSYDELVKRMEWVSFSKGSTSDTVKVAEPSSPVPEVQDAVQTTVAQPVQTAQPTQVAQPAQSAQPVQNTQAQKEQSLDDILNMI